MIISIRGVQSLEPGEEDVMELVTQGVLRQEEGEGFSLSYLESELTGLEGTTTTFRIAPDRITLRREGTLNSEMIFQEGQKHVSLYETPYGGLMLGVNTHRAKADLGTAGAPLHSLCPGSGQPAHWENSFEIQVTEPHLTAPAPGQ
ncbi:MAG: DUF1934 domain-containing protein [Evtepia gabavorous]